MNITLSIDERVAEQPREAAQAMGKTSPAAVLDSPDLRALQHASFPDALMVQAARQSG